MPTRMAVVGHVEHVALTRVDALPVPGDIVHINAPIIFPGGGGGVAYAQLTRAPVEVHFFTAIGSAVDVERELARSGRVHAAHRDVPHPRSVVLVTPDGERTIIVIGAPLHPRRDDPLPWETLATCDGVYFTGEDPETLRAARAARVLVVTARRRASLVTSGVRADVVVGSIRDPREASKLSDYPAPPEALVLTDGARGAWIETASGTVHVPAPPSPTAVGGAYGAGDSFAAALTWYVTAGDSLEHAVALASVHGAAVLRGLDPRENQLPLEMP